MDPLRIGFVAAETSGDRLGAALIRALHERVPDLEAVGVAGEAMRAAGCLPLGDISDLSLMGLTELLTQLPRLLRFRRRLVREFRRAGVDLVIGIDAPDFNLGLERRLRRLGIRTAHYVSPSVWAWRPGRVHSVARAAQAVLCLLPFEPACYEGLPVRAVFTGHPLADELLPQPREAVRAGLGLVAADRVLAVLPGSRFGEVSRLAPPFLGAAARLTEKWPGLRVIVPVARPELRPEIEAARPAVAGFEPIFVAGRAEEAIAASDVVLAASGTATLETMLLDRPMVVAYRMAPVTAWLLLRVGLFRSRFFSLPNLLAGREVVPELAQGEASVAKIAEAAERLLDDADARDGQCAEFAALRRLLGTGAASSAAQAVLDLLDFSDGDTEHETLHRAGGDCGR
ncbi:MAG: lipid-A-disaccharide synthase [Gammaproteobacteria bacterium]